MHGIMENDKMFSGNGIRPWHGLGTIIEGTATSDEAIKLANLGWDVVQEPLYLKNGIEVPNLYANIRSDTNELLGAVKDKYTIVQNKEAFAFTDNIIKNSKGIDARYETAGSLFNGKKVFMLVRLPDVDLVGDAVENYLFVSTSHDGSQGLMAGITQTRIVCSNTLQIAQKGASRIWKLRHTGNIKDKQFEAERALGLALNYVERTQEDAQKMAIQKINEKRFFKKFFEILELSENHKEKLMLDIADVYKNKCDLQNFRGTAWGLYNAICDVVSHKKPLRVTSKTNDWNMVKYMEGYPVIKIAQDIIQESA